MLVLNRRREEKIVIDGGIEVGGVTIRVVSISEGRVKIGVDAPTEMSVHRGEVWERIQREKAKGEGTP